MDPKNPTNTSSVAPNGVSHFELDDYCITTKKNDVVINYTHFGNEPHNFEPMYDRGSDTDSPIFKSDSNAGSSKHGLNKGDNTKRNLSSTTLATGSSTSKKRRIRSPIKRAMARGAFTFVWYELAADLLERQKKAQMKQETIVPAPPPLYLGSCERFQLNRSNLFNRRMNHGELGDSEEPELECDDQEPTASP